MIQTPDDDDLHIAYLHGQSRANEQIRAQQASRIAELEAELKRYRSAPVVAWGGTSGVGEFVCSPKQVWKFLNKPLIIKPEES